MRIRDLAWSLWVICCICSFWSCLGPMLMRGKFLWKMLLFDHGYITCLYVPFYLAGDACPPIVAIFLVYVSILECCSALCIFEKHMHAFVDLLLCRWSRALLPHLEESAILEHFISVVSSRCPCLRGSSFFSLKWSFLGFCWAFGHLLEFFFCFFSFSLFSELVTCVCCQCTHQEGDWGPERPRTGGWSLLDVMSDWQRGVDWLLAEYCRCRLWLDLRWSRWRVGANGLCLAGPLRSGETSRPDSRDPVASGVKYGPHGGKKRKMKSSIRACIG
jgi:hypothetical protein